MKQPIEFGDYYLFERIAVGGMAEVFKAASYGVEGFERVVALKRVLPQISEDQAFIDMFIDEAKIAVQLDHPNISRIYDLGNAESSYFIAMEYVPGHDARALFDRLKSSKQPIDISLCCHIVKEVCEALEYAHAKTNSQGEPLSLIHRDVSPQNILLSYDGQVKLIDFGIAKAAGKATKTRSGILKGKFGYMSPEHVRGRPIDHRSDLFALAVVLYELLTLRRCFRGKDDFSTLEKVRRVDFRSVRELNRSVPPELERIVMKGLAKSPKARFQTAAEFQEALQTFLYQTGSFVSRKNLATLMERTFDAEIKRNRESLNAFRQYARQHIPAARRASSLDDLLAGSAIKMAPTEKLIPKHEVRAKATVVNREQANIHDKPTESMSGPKPVPSTPANRATVKTKERPGERTLKKHSQRTSSNRPKILVGLVATVILIIVGSFLASSQSLEPGRIKVISDPAHVAIYVDSEKVFEGKTPVTLNNIIPNERYFVSLTAPGHDPQERRIMLSDGETYQLRVAMMPSASQTSLRLTSIPTGADVWLDGKRLGETPIKLNDVPPGVRRLEYRLKGVAVKSEALNVGLGEAVVHEVILPPPTIRVSVKTSPPRQTRLAIREDGKSEQLLDPNAPNFEVNNDGRSELIIRAAGYEPEIRKLQSDTANLELKVQLIKSRQTLQNSPTRRINQIPSRQPPPSRNDARRTVNKTNPSEVDRIVTEPGFLSIHSFPSAECFVDGRPLGMTPVYRHRVPSGIHAIMLQRTMDPEFTKTIRVTVPPGDEEKVVYKHSDVP